VVPSIPRGKRQRGGFRPRERESLQIAFRLVPVTSDYNGWDLSAMLQRPSRSHPAGECHNTDTPNGNTGDLGARTARPLDRLRQRTPSSLQLSGTARSDANSCGVPEQRRRQLCAPEMPHCTTRTNFHVLLLSNKRQRPLHQFLLSQATGPSREARLLVPGRSR